MNLLSQTPVHTIASNAGVEGAVVVGKLLEQDDPDFGYDAAKGKSICLFCLFLLMNFSSHLIYNLKLSQTGAYVDMIKAGIIDPVKVIRTALVDAAR